MYKRLSYEFHLIKIKPVKNSLIKKKRLSGRSSKGVQILKYRGGGSSRYYRVVDFSRLLIKLPARVLLFSYDPNRSAFLALLYYINGCFSYVLAPSLLRVGDVIFSGSVRYFHIGNTYPIYRIPSGTFVYNVELLVTKGGIFCRSAGTSIQLLKKIGLFVLIRLPSKEERFISSLNLCSVGKLTFETKKLLFKTKAGSNIACGRKPAVRGVAKNPIDHPHGGGSGRTSAGRPSVTPWGSYTKGIRTTTRFMRKMQRVNVWGFFRRRTGAMW